MEQQPIGELAAGSKPARRYSASRIAAWSLAACLTWLSIIYLPGEALSPALDRSYQGALGYFAEKQMQFGPEVMFTYGPLGYLVPEIYDGTFFKRKLVSELLSKLLITLVLVRIALRLPYLSRAFFLSSVWILAPRFGNSYPEVLFYFSIAAASPILSRNDRWRNYFFAPLLVFLSFVSLIKLTLLVSSLLVVLLLSVYWAMKRNWKLCLSIPAVFAALILLSWAMAGQKWMNFPTWIFTSTEVASGYQQCMGIDPEPGVLLLALAVVSVVLYLFGVSVYALRKNLSACIPLLCLAASYWLSWKHGFIRADDHVNLFFGFCLLGFASFAAFVNQPASAIRIRQALAGVGCVLCLTGIYVKSPAFLTDGLTYSVSHLFETTRRLAAITTYQAQLNEKLSAQKMQFEWPKMKAEVGKSTVDVFGNHQGIALLNDLNYHPRPAFQSYSAYTPFLIHANAEFYRSDAAPTYVISLLQSVDGRFPAQEDSEALRVLLLDYDLVMEENEWLLWKRSPFRKTVAEEIAGADTAEIGFDQDFPLSETNLWAVLDIKQTAFGKLRSFFYKPPILLISVTEEDHLTTIARILPPVARYGFMLDPFLRAQTDIIGLKTKFAPKPNHISSFKVVVNDSSQKYFAPRISIRLSRIAPFGQND